MQINSKNISVTKKFASQIARRILKTKPQKHATVIALVGDLGAGKTTFVQGFAKAFGVKHKVNSPTFLIMRPYPITSKKYERFVHVDVYRISKASELENLHFKHVLKQPTNIVVIEWADKIKRIVPKDAIWLHFSHGRTEKERLITD